MNNMIAALCLILLTGCSSMAQMGYTDYSKQDGLDIATKWAKAKDTDGVKKPALLLGIENTNAFAVEFSFEILFYYEGLLRETASIDTNCLDGLKSSIGKLNGIYFIPSKFTPEQLESSDFSFELAEIEVGKIANCDSAEENE